jgi:gamma-glutamyltranspeptidase/glutathione hydrolase
MKTGVPPLRPTLTGTHGMVTAEHHLSAIAGLQMLLAGGNAVDAAVAAILVEGLVNPDKNTLGGEVPMLIYSAAERRVYAINGNTCAPRAATIDLFRSRGIDLIPNEGLLGAGVPATLDALVTALDRFGTMTFAQVAAPVIAHAERGIALHTGIRGQGFAWTIGGEEDRFLHHWPSSARVYCPGGAWPQLGTRFRNPDLAATYRLLVEAEDGARRGGRSAGLRAARDRFYRGDIARQIVQFSAENGGLLALEDFADFETRVEEPVSADYRGVQVFKCPPWSQGPVFLQSLRLLEGFNLCALGHNSAAYIHTLTEALKLAFADRERYYGDPECVDVPLEGLLARQYAESRRTLIDPATASAELRPGDPRTGAALLREVPSLVGRGWGAGTSHVDAVDADGNLVAATPSGAWISSSPVVEGLGFPLTTRCQTFYLEEGHANALAPGKRPRTTLTPSLALREGRPYLAFGTPGGDNQDQWSLQFFLNVVDFGMELQEAIEAPKFSSTHWPNSFYPHKAEPKRLRVEGRIPTRVRRRLAEMGHDIAVRADWSEGFVLAVMVHPETGILQAGADPRGAVQGAFQAYAAGW